MKRASDDTLAEVLAQCTDLMRAGIPLPDCLARYPEHAATLEPLLRTVAEVRRHRPVPARAPAVVEQRRAQFMLALEQVAASQPVGTVAELASRAPTRRGSMPAAGVAAGLAAWWQRLTKALLSLGGGAGAPRAMPAGLAAILLIVFMLGLTATGIVSASNNALPGDLLFSVKTGLEDARFFTIHDPEARASFQEERAALRRNEAKTIADLGRKVNDIELRGVIKDIRGDVWQVSDLAVRVMPDTVIIGSPAVGASVSGTMRAPGDHTLVAVYVEIEPPTNNGSVPDSAAPAQSPSTPTDAPTDTPTAAPSATATPEPTSDPDFAPLPLVTAAIAEPTEAPTSTPTAIPTATPTATHTPLPTSTPTSTPTDTPTTTPTPFPTPPRELPKGRIIGFVTRVEGSWWTIDEVTVECDAGTQFFGNPDIGSRVEAVVEVRPNGSVVGLEIHAIGAPDPTPSPWEFTGILEAINGEWWNIGGASVKVMGDTVLEENPGIGDTVTVKGQMHGSEIWALRIRALRERELNFRGTVETMGGDGWVIDGTRVIVDGSTQVEGDPQIGSVVDVVAVQKADGQIVAKRIVAVQSQESP